MKSLLVVSKTTSVISLGLIAQKFHHICYGGNRPFFNILNQKDFLYHHPSLTRTSNFINELIDRISSDIYVCSEL